MKIRASHILVDTKEQAESLLLDIDNGISFEVDGDAGLYRIRTENRYKGTLCVGYTDVFAVYAR